VTLAGPYLNARYQTNADCGKSIPDAELTIASFAEFGPGRITTSENVVNLYLPPEQTVVKMSWLQQLRTFSIASRLTYNRRAQLHLTNQIGREREIFGRFSPGLSNFQMGGILKGKLILDVFQGE
jgi:hypothetical protein